MPWKGHAKIGRRPFWCGKHTCIELRSISSQYGQVYRPIVTLDDLCGKVRDFLSEDSISDIGKQIGQRIASGLADCVAAQGALCYLLIRCLSAADSLCLFITHYLLTI